MSDTPTAEVLRDGRLNVCDACGWVGDGSEAKSGIVDGRPHHRCPDCNMPTHKEFFGNPIPEEGSVWKTPSGVDECPACSTKGIFVKEEPNACLCGAKFSGLSRLELLEAPERGEQDVILRASEADLRHKVFDYMDVADNDVQPRQSLAYWRVNGTPQRTGPGRTIMFSTDGETVDYYAPICAVEDGKIWFDFLSPTQFDAPTEPPTRGFKYFDWGDYRW